MKHLYQTTVVFWVLIFSTATLKAQLIDVPLSELQAVSTSIVEGTVTAKETFWNDAENRIYTLYQFSVADYLVGSGDENLSIVVRGGCVGDRCQEVNPGLEMGVGTSGVLFLRPFTREPLHSDDLLEVISGPLGYLEFFRQDGRRKAANGVRIFHDLNREIYIPIAGRPRQVEAQILPPSPRTGAPVIDSLYPTILAAGVHDTLTIEGSCFGDTLGKVWFQNANKPIGVYMRGDDPDFVVWSDTLIRLLIPSTASLDSNSKGVAGTGTIRVEDSNGMVTETVDPITIEYALGNRRTALDGIGYSSILSSPNNPAQGGYIFRLDTNFAQDTAAASVFRKALRDWRCATGVNFTIGRDSTIQEAAGDEVNAVFWGALDPGVLGETTVDTRYCTDDATGRVYYHTLGIDMEFSSTAAFHIDTITVPGPMESDFYSVVLHELGHAHLLKHITLPGALMHFSITIGTTSRTIDLKSEEAGNRLLDSSIVNHSPSCRAPMVRINPADCNVLNHASEQVEPIRNFVLYPVPAQDQLIIQADWDRTVKEYEIEIFNSIGQVVYAQSSKQNGKRTLSLPIDVQQLDEGWYIVRIKTPRSSIGQSFTIQR